MTNFFKKIQNKIDDLFHDNQNISFQDINYTSIIEPKIIIPPQPSTFNYAFLQNSIEITDDMNFQIENFFKNSISKSIQSKDVKNILDLTHHLSSMHAVKLFALLYYFSSVSSEEGDKRHADEINTLIYGDMQIYMVHLSWRMFLYSIEIMQKHQAFFKSFSIFNYMENEDISFHSLLGTVAAQTNIKGDKFSSDNYDFFVDCYMKRKNNVSYSKVDELDNAANKDMDLLNKIGIIGNKPYEMVNYIKLKDFFNNPFESRNEDILNSINETFFYKYLNDFRNSLYK